MRLVQSKILPGPSDNELSIAETIIEQAKMADEIKIAVGYVSEGALEELDHLVESLPVKNITLIMGMYLYEGMPERSYRLAMKINEKWKSAGTGEIRAVYPFKYHGKVFTFYKDGAPFSTIMGSSNLGVLRLDANNRRQFELDVLLDNPKNVREMADHLAYLEEGTVSKNLSEFQSFPLIREKNTSLVGVEGVSEQPMADIEFYKRLIPQVEIELPLKVPNFNDRFKDDNAHYTKSNINVSYAAPRSPRKPRDWFETQMTVSKKITTIPGYPKKNEPFFIVTDDGYSFKAHTTSDGNKQFSAVGDELIMGRWLKGRLAAAGLVTPVNDTKKDTDRAGMITREMLDEYGCDHLSLKKTGYTLPDEDGKPLDVWLLSFEQKVQEE